MYSGTGGTIFLFFKSIKWVWLQAGCLIVINFQGILWLHISHSRGLDTIILSFEIPLTFMISLHVYIATCSKIGAPILSKEAPMVDSLTQ